MPFIVLQERQFGCKHVYKVKNNAYGTTYRYKGRLVAKRYTHEEGLDFVDIFSPAAKLTIAKILLGIDEKLNWTLTHLDVSNIMPL